MGETMNKITSYFSYTWGVVCAAIGAYSLNEIALIVGIITALGSFAINWAYKHLKYKRSVRQDNETNELVKAIYAKYNKDIDRDSL